METLFGRLEFLVCGEDQKELEVDVQIIEQEIDECFLVDGRYLIEMRITPKKSQIYNFAIHFTTSRTITNAYVEAGEHLELKSWFSDNLKWSLGAVDEDWLRALRNVDLTEVEYLDDGISLKIDGIPPGEPFMLPFGVAWKESADLEDASTWFAASPSAMYPPKWLEQKEK
ncbi:hypothetical protein [Planomicrobium okeanokoites]|uniref:hypothetical protein n=1 Tax=Planomicrobium okeanokoites TaxID=244 RepID=UPI0030FC3670